MVTLTEIKSTLETLPLDSSDHKIIEMVFWSAILGEQDASYFLRKTLEMDYLEKNLHFITNLRTKIPKLLRKSLIFLIEEDRGKHISHYSIIPKEFKQEGAKRDLIEFYSQKMTFELPSKLDSLRSPNVRRLFLYMSRSNGRISEDDMKLFLDIYAIGKPLKKAIKKLSEEYWILCNEDKYGNRFYFFPLLDNVTKYKVKEWPTKERLFHNLASSEAHEFQGIIESFKEENKIPASKNEFYELLTKKCEKPLEEEGLIFVKMDAYRPYINEVYDKLLFSVPEPLKLGHDFLEMLYNVKIEKDQEKHLDIRNELANLPKIFSFLLTSDRYEISLKDLGFVKSLQKTVQYLQEEFRLSQIKVRDDRVIFDKNEILECVSLRKPFHEVLRRKIFEEISHEPNPMAKITLALKLEVQKMNVLEPSMREYFNVAVEKFLQACKSRELSDLSLVFRNLHLILEGKPLDIDKIRKWEKELYKKVPPFWKKYQGVLKEMTEEISAGKDVKKFGMELANLLSVITHSIDEWPYLFLTAKILSTVNNLRNVFAAHKISFGKPTEYEAFYAILSTYMVLSTWAKIKPLMDKYELQS